MTTYQFGNTPILVDEGQTVRFRFKAPTAWDSSQNVTVQIGQMSTVWVITTIPQDFAPDTFAFTTLENADPDTLYTYGDGARVGETIVTVGGLSGTTEVEVVLTSSHINPTVNEVAVRRKRISQGESAWSSWDIPTGWMVSNTDQLQIRLKSNPAYALSHYANLRVGTRTEKWTINTKAPVPNFPDPFPAFLWLEDRKLDVDVYSNVVQIQGMSDPGLIVTDNNAKIGISSSNTTVTNSDGYQVLDGVTFVESSSSPTITNAQFIQLMLRSSATANTAISVNYNIGTGASGSIWRVETGDLPSITPDTFIFSDKIDQDEDVLIESDQQPSGGLTGLGTDVSVPVTLLSTTGSAPGVRIKHDGSWSSWGIFPTSVVLGDEIQIRNKSNATFNGTVSTEIKVGSREISPWTITTNSGPDTDASFTPPGSLTNTAPNTIVVSSIVPITGINRPITISATNDAKISVDFGAFVTGPVTFDPDTNTSFQLQILTNQSLSGQVTSTVTVGTGSTNNPFTWGATNYAVAPPPPELKGCWYSKKTAFVDMSGGGSGVIRQNKEDGYAIGTVIPILKDPVDASDPDPMKQYGELKGSTNKGRLDAKYPGYLDCDGSEYNVADFPDLWNVIGNTYAKSSDDASQFGEWNITTKVYTGKFRVPDYRNRKIVGPGQVDGNKGASTILPIDTGLHPTKTFNAREAGGIGGYWYVDDVDVTAGDPNPYQQIVGDVGGSSGISSDFFNFGTVRTVLSEDITVDIEFEVVGSVTATIGPLSETQVEVPSHDHLYFSAVTGGGGGDPLIAWNQRALFGYMPYNFKNSPTEASNWLGDKLGRVSWPTETNSPVQGSGTNTGGHPKLYFNNPDGSQGGTTDFTQQISQVRDTWLSFLAQMMPDFEREWNLVHNITDLEDEVYAMMQNIDEDHPGPFAGGISIQASTWWVHPGDSVPDAYFVDLGASISTIYSLSSSGIATGTAGTTTTAGSVDQQYVNGEYAIWNAKVMAAIDTRESLFRVDDYEAPIIHEDNESTTSQHCHYLSELPITDFNLDYSYGNANSGGVKQGLGTAALVKPVTFNQSDVNIELNTGTFTLNKGTKLPAPNVAFHPNRKVELVPNFHKVKYIIKAF